MIQWVALLKRKIIIQQSNHSGVDINNVLWINSININLHESKSWTIAITHSFELDFANLDNINGHFRKNASINLYQEKKTKNKVPTLTEKFISLLKIHQDLIDETPRFQVCVSKITTIQQHQHTHTHNDCIKRHALQTCVELLTW